MQALATIVQWVGGEMDDLGLSMLITKRNREALNLFWNKTELNIHYKKESRI